MANADANPPTNSGDSNNGMLLVQRYPVLHNNVLAALCNAAQEPGLSSNFCLMRSTSLQPGQRNLKADDVRMPHIFDVVTVLAQHMSEGSARTMNPKDLCVFMGGFVSEAEEFMRLCPKFFFITCDVLEVKDDVPVWSTESIGPRTPLVIPVILRGGYYYIIVGQENIPVFRVHHPKQFFFSIDGKALLIRMLTHWYCKNGNMFELVHTNDGKHTFYCLPTFNIGDGWPCELWEDLKLDEVNAIVPFQIVREPVTYHQKYVVQVVELNDSTNVVDIRFPESESN